VKSLRAFFELSLATLPSFCLSALAFSSATSPKINLKVKIFEQRLHYFYLLPTKMFFSSFKK
jgi:hypothetical protein